MQQLKVLLRAMLTRPSPGPLVAPPVPAPQVASRLVSAFSTFKNYDSSRQVGAGRHVAAVLVQWPVGGRCIQAAAAA